MKLTLRSMILLLPLISVTGLASAQVSTGLPTFATFNGGPDIVNLANLNVHLVMPIQARGGRKLPFVYNLGFNSSIWSPVTSSGGHTWTPATGFGFTVGLPAWNGVVSSTGTQTCTYIPPPYNYNLCYGSDSGFTYTDANGTVHPTNYVYSWVCTPSCTYGSTGSLVSYDDSGYTILSSTAVSDLTGDTIYTAASSQGTAGSMEDTNGNYVSANTSGSNVVLTDTLGSTPLTLPPPSCTAPCTIIYTVPTGTVGITYYSYPIKTNFGCSGVAEYGPTNQNLPYDIILPDGTAYVFIYEHTPGFPSDYTGRIAEIGLPTGGTINFTYTGGSHGVNCGDGSAAGLTRVGPDGTWTYGRTFGSGAASTVTITDPLNNQKVVSFQGIYPTESQSYQGSASPGNLLETLVTCYNGTAPSGSPATCNSAAITLPITSKTQYLEWPGTTTLESETNTLFNSLGQPTESDEYSYGSGSPGALLRKTLMTYGTLNRLSSTTIKNGAAATVLQTNYGYDGSALAPASGMSQHDDTNYGVTRTTRGNLTSTQSLVSGSTYVSSSATYDTTGQMVTDSDALGNVSTYSYTDNFYTDNGANPPATYTPSKPTNAYLTSITVPVIGLLAHYGYYFANGQEAFATDQTTSTEYNHYDSIGRLTNQTLPPSQGGSSEWTLIQYPSSSETDFYTGITSGTPSTSCTSCRHTNLTLDSLGRPSSEVLVSDPDGATTTTTTYDGLGRTSTVTNPYRSTSDPTYGIQTKVYDGMSRVTSVTHPDTTVSITSYGINVGTSGGLSSQLCSTTTYGLGYPVLLIDPAGNKIEHWLNSLGQLIETDEANSSGSLTVPSCFLYNVLGNLTQSVQGSLSRSYSYDGLSRVTAESSPETGSTSISYTNSSGGLCSGNPVTICRKTDARGITQTNQYDNLNRLTLISYSDGVTPQIQYLYDQTSYNGLSITNGKNRMTGMSDGNGSSAFSFDALGHVVNENRTTSGVTKSLSYVFNLDGSLGSITYPSGRTIVYQYGNAGRPLSATDSGTGVVYASSATYAPQGGLSTLSVGPNGTFAGIAVANTFNNRLQLTAQMATSSGGTALNLQYGFPIANNGDSSTITNNVDNGRSVSLTYDTLSRLQTAQSQATTGPDCWGQSYGYDSYANLLSVTVTKCSGNSLSVSMTNNKITNSGFAYDLSGNLTNDSAYSYAYDGAGRLTSGGGVTYLYDGRNYRIEKSNGTIYWRGFSGDTFTESGLSGNVTNDYVYFDGARTARVDATGNVYYYFLDKLGSTRAITNNTGSVCYSADFTPFGSEIQYLNSCPQNYKFTGYERDAETNLDYANLRSYDSRIGRFTAADPLKGAISKPQSLNRYTYVLNDPCNLIDPTGLCDVVGAGVGDNPTDPKNTPAALEDFANSIGADTAFPFSNEGKAGAVLSNASGGDSVLRNAILHAYKQTDTANGGKVNVLLWSGSAQTFQNVYPTLPEEVQNSIGNVVYLSPFLANGDTLVTGTNQTVVYHGDTSMFSLEGQATSSAIQAANDQGIPVQQYPDPDCQGHKVACAFNPTNNLGQYKGDACPDKKTFTGQDPGGSSTDGYPGFCAYCALQYELDPWLNSGIYNWSLLQILMWWTPTGGYGEGKLVPMQ